MKKNIWKRCGIVLLLAAVFSLCAACSNAGKNFDGSREKGFDGSQEESLGEDPVESTEGNLEENPEGSIDENAKESLEETTSVIYGDYFKEGDAMYRLNISQAAPQDGDFLYISILRRDPEYSRYNSGLQEFHVFYKEGTTVYEAKDEITGGNYRITFGEGGIVSVESENGNGTAEELGTFYAFESNLMMPDAFERPLCRADLLGLSKQELRLLRNQFYAVYGRKFQDETLKNYFEGKSWYQGRIEPDAFAEETFGRLEKSNIAFLQEVEDSFDEKQAEEDKKTYEMLADAPYLGLLPENGEVAVSLHKDSGNAKDMGIYYEVQGSISLPVVLTQDEYRTLHQGEEVTITLDELTGETAALRKSGEEQSIYYISQGDYQSEAFLAYDEQLGGYHLWEASDDTVFRKVYEGSIYVLKGAIYEYAGYFEIPEEETQKWVSEYSEMEFDGDDTEETYWANRPVWDGKGYLRAMFFFGD